MDKLAPYLHVDGLIILTDEIRHLAETEREISGRNLQRRSHRSLHEHEVHSSEAFGDSEIQIEPFRHLVLKPAYYNVWLKDSIP